MAIHRFTQTESYWVNINPIDLDPAMMKASAARKRYSSPEPIWPDFLILIGQRRKKFSFGMQDLLLTEAVFLIVGLRGAGAGYNRGSLRQDRAIDGGTGFFYPAGPDDERAGSGSPAPP
jgi:hypothetical protein